MTRLEAYSQECGVKPNEAHDIPTSFVPLPDKYITISARSGIEIKDYTYFDLVVSILHPALQAKQIAIIHLCEPEEQNVPNTFKLNLTFRQTAHALKNSLCHITVENASAHIAAGFKTPVVELFHQKCSVGETPHYKGVYKALEGNKTVFNYGNTPAKPIDSIMPETVANEVFEILGLDKTPIKTEYIGPQYNQLCFDLIPNFQPDFNQIKGAVIVRMDQAHNEDFLLYTLFNRNEATNIVFRKPFEKEIPLDRVGYMIFMFGDDYDKDYIKSLDKGKTILVYDGPKENLSKVRMDLESPFNCGVVHSVGKGEFPLEVNEESKVTSRRIFLSAGRAFASLYHVKRGIPGSTVQIGKALTSRDFYDYSNYYYIHR